MAGFINETISRIKAQHTPIEKFSNEFKAYFWTHWVFMFSVGLSSAFINIFIYSVHKDIKVVMLFNLVQFAVAPFAFWLASVVAKKVSVSFNMRMGIVFFNILYIMLLIFQENSVKYIVLFAAIQGLSQGFYYQGNNVTVMGASTNNSRDKILGIIGIVVTISGAVAPSIAGFIINYNRGKMQGYVLVFSMALVLSFISGALSLKIRTQKYEGKLDVIGHLILTFRQKNWIMAMWGDFFRGVREGVINFLPPLLLYIVLTRNNNGSSELVVGLNFLAASAMALIAFFIFVRQETSGLRLKYIFYATTILVVASISLYFCVNVYTVFTFNMISAFASVFLINPAIAITYNVIQQASQKVDIRYESLVVREVYIAAGRAFGSRHGRNHIAHSSPRLVGNCFRLHKSIRPCSQCVPPIVAGGIIGHARPQNIL